MGQAEHDTGKPRDPKKPVTKKSGGAPTQKVAGAGPAIAERSKDAKAGKEKSR